MSTVRQSRKSTNNMYSAYVKRALDVILASIILFASLPLTILVAVAIKLESRGPIFFKQVRAGRNGEPFTLIKFRSMTAHNNVYDDSVRDEVTRVGHLIRRTSLDELPQLINVLKGEMSFIGPRPWLPEYFLYMNEHQRKRYEVRPGITGLAQARGRNALSIHDKVRCDIEYVSNICFWKDVLVVYHTLRTMFDPSTLDIGKHGIKDELAMLREQDSQDKQT